MCERLHFTALYLSAFAAIGLADSRPAIADDRPRKPIAVVIVLDKSGSMAARLEKKQTKLDVAKQAAESIVKELQSEDPLSVIGFDTKAQLLSPLKPIKSSRSGVITRIRAANSGGGGCYVDEALASGAEVLRKTSGIRRRHLIYIVDARDVGFGPRNRNKQLELPRRLAKRGVTISVIAIGDKKDAGAALAAAIAKQGKGLLLFLKKPTDAKKAAAVIRENSGKRKPQ